MTFDDPLAILIRSSELWHKHPAAVEQGSMVIDADDASSGALTDQRPDSLLPKLIGMKRLENEHLKCRGVTRRDLPSRADQI
jgi:hypothetical protein